MTEAEVKALIQQELPHLLSQDPSVRDFVLLTVANHYASKPETESRFDRVLDELERDRQVQARKWEEQNRKWDEFTHEQNRKWDEQNRQNQALLKEIQAMNRKHESTIGALGSRWGIASEVSFRNALQGILEESFGVQVLNLNLFDHEGEVFGRPDQVEIDLIIKNGLTIACEIKSSIDKAGMYSFARKVEFYAKHENCEITRKMVISPMVDRRAVPVAEALGIELYSYADTVENL
ncbi:MAG: DUF3782 domain-containing protein [Synechocystis sp.]|nr:DUF3782 domain-containing protein [Synechocystis sp.]